MKLKDKIKSYSFWVSLASAVILILKILGTRFGFSVDETMVSDLFTALCSILVLLGIIVVPTNIQTAQKNKPANNQPFDKKEQINSETINKATQTIEVEDKCKTSTPTETTLVEASESNFVESIDQDFNVQPQESTKLFEESKENQTIIQSNQEQSENSETSINETTKEVSSVLDLKTILEFERKKHAGNLDAYLFELQEEIRKTREGM